MSITLAELEAEVRALTRHKLDTRVTSADITIFANRSCRRLRTKLRTIAPELYRITCAPIEFDSLDASAGEYNSIILTDVDFTFEQFLMIERQRDDGTWYPLERASSLDPDQSVHGGVSFSLSHDELRLHPNGATGGTYRVTAYALPANLAAPGDYFQIPAGLEQALSFYTCGLVAIEDGDGAKAKKEWDELAKAEIDDYAESAKEQHGIHPDTGGLRRVMRR